MKTITFPIIINIIMQSSNYGLTAGWHGGAPIMLLLLLFRLLFVSCSCCPYVCCCSSRWFSCSFGCCCSFFCTCSLSQLKYVCIFLNLSLYPAHVKVIIKKLRTAVLLSYVYCLCASHYHESTTRSSAREKKEVVDI